MNILLDTHVLLSVLENDIEARFPGIATLLQGPASTGYASVASLWEIAIKSRLGKLDPGMPLDEIAGYLEKIGLKILPIEASHATAAAADPEPATRDPFDRLLLAQCQVEWLKLATIDGALLDHRLALKA